MRLFLPFLALAATLGALSAPLDEPSALLLERGGHLGGDILAPNSTGGVWTRGFAKARELVEQMTIEEKVNVTSGYTGFCVGYTGEVPRLGVKPLCMADGPSSVRPSRGVSQFPAAITAGATWSRRLISARAKAMAQEFKDRGVNIALSPVTGSPLGRSPLGGRDWENWSADSYLSSIASFITVRDMQANGLACTAKHWLGNEQETRRRPFNRSEDNDFTKAPIGQSVDSRLDDRTTHELYAFSFAEAVRAGTAFIMSSYNRLNGTQASADALSQNYILKDMLNFHGSVMSDWGGTHSNDAYNGGMDISMPGNSYGGLFGNFGGASLLADIKAGRVPEWRIHDAAIRTLAPILELQGDQQWPEVSFDVRDTTRSLYPSVRKPETADLIREIGEEAVVLLHNNRSAGLGLPLKPRHVLRSLALLGEGAFDKPTGWTSCGQGGGSCSEYSKNGTLTMGGGSGWGIPSYILSGAAVMQHEARRGAFDINLDASDGYMNLSNFRMQARASEAALVFVNAWSTEGNDRPNITLFGGGDRLVKAAASECNNTIVVINSGGVVLVEDWIKHENVTAVLYAGFPGQEGAGALPAILFGDKSPSGKLPFTWGRSLDQYLPNSIARVPDIAPVANFDEGTLGGDWHWFEYKNATPRYAFGHGLSYTTFEISGVTVADSYAPDTTSIQKTNEKWSATLGAASGSVYDTLLEVTAEVTNTGDVAGAEVAQLYVTFPPTEARPARQLRGFEKVLLQPGETQTVTFPLRRKDLSVWSTDNQNWMLLSGDYHFGVGGSSDNAPVAASFSF